jgi:hypothetical protein
MLLVGYFLDEDPLSMFAIAELFNFSLFFIIYTISALLFNTFCYEFYTIASYIIELVIILLFGFRLLG